MKRLNHSGPLLSVVAASLLIACGGDSLQSHYQPPVTTSPADARFTITATNLTAGQPMSPLAIIAHDRGYQMFMLGNSASVALEKLAEAGETQSLIDSAMSHAGYIQSTKTSAMILPGQSMTLNLNIPQDKLAMAYLSAATMLAKTNDAFSALNAQAIGQLNVGESLQLNLASYDAGTEANTETAATIPALGGAGFDVARDDISNLVAVHPGIISQDDGFSSSALNQSHRWDNPTLKLTIQRIE